MEGNSSGTTDEGLESLNISFTADDTEACESLQSAYSNTIATSNDTVKKKKTNLPGPPEGEMDTVDDLNSVNVSFGGAKVESCESVQSASNPIATSFDAFEQKPPNLLESPKGEMDCPEDLESVDTSEAKIKAREYVHSTDDYQTTVSCSTVETKQTDPDPTEVEMDTVVDLESVGNSVTRANTDACDYVQSADTDLVTTSCDDGPQEEDGNRCNSTMGGESCLRPIGDESDDRKNCTESQSVGDIKAEYVTTPIKEQDGDSPDKYGDDHENCGDSHIREDSGDWQENAGEGHEDSGDGHQDSGDGRQDSADGNVSPSSKIVDVAGKCLGCLRDAGVDIPINKEEGEVSSHEDKDSVNISFTQAYTEECEPFQSTDTDPTMISCVPVERMLPSPIHLKHSELPFSPNEISEDNQVVGSVQDAPGDVHHPVEDILPKVLQKDPEVSLDLEVGNVKEQQKRKTTRRKKTLEQVLAAGVQKSMINVYITWTDNEGSQNVEIKWQHQNCDVCSCIFADWKQHVAKEHGTFEEKVKRCSPRKLHIPRKIVKTEPLDTDPSLVNISVPALVSLKSLCDQAQLDTQVNLTPSEQKRKANTVKASSDVQNVQKSVLVNNAAHVPHRRKKGKPRRIKQEIREALPMPVKGRNKQATSATLPMPTKRRKTKQDKSETMPIKRRKIKQEISETLPMPIKRKVGRPRKKPLAEGDPEYIPVEQSRSLRPKKPIEYTPVRFFVCNKEGCGTMFDTWKDCKKHEKRVHGNKIFECNYEGCGKMFKAHYMKVRHETTHDTGPNKEKMKRGKDAYLKCKYCNMRFTSVKDRALHSKMHISFKCGHEGCERTYTTQKEMQRHQVTHSMKRDLPCPLCQKKFMNKRAVAKHIQTHTGKTHQCDDCHKSFKNQKALDRHRRLHTGEGLLVCQFCGKKLNGKSSLDRHERLHKGEKPYKCEFCNKAFVCCNSLQTHKQEHTGYQFVCAQCGHKFKSKGNLLEHERSHTGENPYHCRICDKYFRTGSGLWTHKQARHSLVKRYKCEVCNKAFWTHSSLAKHKVVHTGERRFECKHCHKRFGNSGIRAGHIKQVHLGIKRTGHQGKAKRARDEMKTSPTTKDDPKTMEPIGSKVHRSEVKSTGGLPLMMIPPLRVASDPGRHLPAPVVPPGPTPHLHPPHGDPSRSDFYSMVESFIQFSKEH